MTPITPFGWHDGSSPPINTANLESFGAHIGEYTDLTTTNVFNVKHYGAKGDNKTDDHAACQAAIVACEASGTVNGGSGIVYFPPALSNCRYKLSAALKYSNGLNVNFLGSGDSATIQLSADLLFGESIFMTIDETHSENTVQHIFENLTVRGPENYPFAPKARSTNGYAPCRAMGIEATGGSVVNNCHAEVLYAGISARSFGQIINLFRSEGCFYDTYFGPTRLVQKFKKGGVHRINCKGFPKWAKFGVHSSMSTETGVLIGEGTTNNPYGLFYKEAPAGYGSGFVESYEGMQCGGEAIGNAWAYDECNQEGIPTEYKSINQSFTLKAQMVNMQIDQENRVGNAQTLTKTATGGTMTLTLPAQTIPNGFSFAGATTAAFAWNATAKQIEEAIEKVAPSALSGVSVSEPEVGKILILLEGTASLMGESKMVVNTGELTGGTATLSAPFCDPNMGPLVRPVTPQVFEVIKATGGTYTVTVEVNGGSPQTTAAIPYNASPQEWWEAVAVLTNITPWGLVISRSSVVGKYILFFNGRTLGQTVRLTFNTTSLIGTEKEIKVTEGPQTTMGLRHSKYTIDVGNLSLNIKSTEASILNTGTEGFAKTAGEVIQFHIESDATLALLGECLSGERVMVLSGAAVRGSDLRGPAGQWRLMEVPGPIQVGQLIATNGAGNQGIIYPAETNKGSLVRPHAGFAAAAVATGKTSFIAVMVEGWNDGASGVRRLEALYDAAGTPAAFKYLKPSTTTAGSVTTCTELSDHIVAISVAAGSAGKVESFPRGCS